MATGNHTATTKPRRGSVAIPMTQGIVIGLVLAYGIILGIDMLVEHAEAEASRAQGIQTADVASILPPPEVQAEPPPEEVVTAGEGLSKFYPYDGVIKGNEVLNLNSEQWVAVRFMDAPLSVRLTRNGNIECYADDNGDCGNEGDVLTLDAIGKRVWLPISGASAP